MSEFDTHFVSETLLEFDDRLREALRMLEELRKAGVSSGEYNLAPSFGGTLPDCDRSNLNTMRAIYAVER